jgi:hypothetical protein
MRRLPLILLTAHSTLVIGIATAVFLSLRAGSREAIQLWGLATFVDLPITPVLFWLESWTPVATSNESIARWVVVPAVEYLILGGAWWFAVGWVLRRSWTRRQSHVETELAAMPLLPTDTSK